MKKTVLFHLLMIASILAFSQNVGIGTASPAFKLDVAGRMRIKTGTLNSVSTSSGVWFEDYRDGTNQVFVGMQDSIRVGFYGANTGVGWGFNFNAKTGNVGIGITNALSALHVHSPSNTFNSYIRLTHQLSGTNYDDGAYMGLDGNNLLFNNSESGIILFSNAGGDVMRIAANGNVGIGIPTPTESLHLFGNIKLQSSTSSILFHNNSTDRAIIGLDGNDLNIGTSANNTTGRVVFRTNNTDMVAVSALGELNRPSRTGSVDMLPLAYGKISASGTVLSGTGNFTATHTSVGVYTISLPAESNLFSNKNNYTMIFTPTGTDFFDTDPTMIISAITSSNVIEVHVTKPYLYWTNSSCSEDCGPFSYITGFKFHDESDKQFSFIIYKP